MDERRRRLQKDARAGDRDSLLRLLAARCQDEGCVRRDERETVVLSSRHPLAEWLPPLYAHRIRYQISVPKAGSAVVEIPVSATYMGDPTSSPSVRQGEMRFDGRVVETWSESSYGLTNGKTHSFAVKEGGVTITLEFLLRNCEVNLHYHFDTESCFRCGNL